MSLVANERLKLTATFLNGVAVASVAAGAIAPLAAYTYQIPGAVDGATVTTAGATWLTGGIGLHLVARWLLRRLKE